MALASVQTTGLQSTGSVASLAKAFTSNVTAGNLIVVGACTFEAPRLGTGSCTDSRSNSYTRRSQIYDTVGTDDDVAIYSAHNISGGSCTVTITPSGGNAYTSLGMIEVSGADTSAPYDTQNTGTGGSGGSSTPATGNLVTASGNTIIVGVVTHNGSTSPSITPGTNYTQVFEDEDTSDQCINVEYRIVASGTYTASWTLGSSQRWSAAAASFKEAAGGATTSPPLFRRWQTVIRRRYR